MNGNFLTLNHICRTVVENPSYMFANVLVPENTTLYAGDIVLADNLISDNDIYGNNSVYEAGLTIGNEDIPAIILNGNFEELDEGRRPDGNPDYTTYGYKSGDVATAIRLINGIKLELSPDNFSNRDEIITAIQNDTNFSGTYIGIADNQLFWTNDASQITSKMYLYVEAAKMFRLGGQFGNDFAYTFVVRVKESNGAITPSDPEITAINADITEGLQVGNENVAAGATVLTMEAVGGTAPITFEFTENEGAGADNASFIIEDNMVRVGETALGEAKTYQIYLTAVDSKGKTFSEGFDIPVADAE